MTWILGKKGLIAAALLISIATGAWLYNGRKKAIDLASYVPESALGFLEINDWPRVVENMSSTEGWRRLAPAYGMSGKLEALGKIGWLSGLGIGGEAGTLARSQFALVVTGLEVRGEEIKPHLALIIETHSSPSKVQSILDARLPKFARDAFGEIVEETSDHSGVKVLSYRAARSERRVCRAQIESEVIIANQLEALQACIDARMGRGPSMAENFYVSNSRSIVERDGSAFGFVSGEGVRRFLRFGAFLASGGALGKAALAGAVGEIFTEFSSRTSDGLAYGASFENGGVAERYAVLFKPDLADALRKTIKPSPKESGVLSVVPASATSVTLITVQNPLKTLDGVESAISSRVGAAQSFLLHQFMIGARETFFGLPGGRRVDQAIGDEIVGFSLAADPKTPTEAGRLWAAKVNDRALLSPIVEQALTVDRATLGRERHREYEILVSGNRSRGGAVFMNDVLLLGGRDHLIRVIDQLAGGQTFQNDLKRLSLGGLGEGAALKSFSDVKDEAAGMMLTLAKWTAKAAGEPGGAPGPVESIPFAVSASSITSQGVFVESRSPFGSLPLLVSIADGAIDGK
jgi:hypothetical protein